MFQAMQRSAANKPAAAAKQKLAVLDLKRATAVGIRMSRLRCATLFMVRSHDQSPFTWTKHVEHTNGDVVLGITTVQSMDKLLRLSCASQKGELQQ